MSKYVWIKYNTNHSSGPGPTRYQEVSYGDFASKEAAIKSEIEDLDYMLNTHSEHWRGITWEEIVAPPEAWLIEHCKRLTSQRIAARRAEERALVLLRDQYRQGPLS